MHKRDIPKTAGTQYAFKSFECKLHRGAGHVGQPERDAMLLGSGEMSKPGQANITADYGGPGSSKDAS